MGGVLVLLLGALVMIFLPNMRRDEAPASASLSTAGAPAQDVPMASPVVVESSTPVAAPAAQLAVAGAVTPALSAASSTPTVASPTLVITPPAAAKPAPAPAAALVPAPAAPAVPAVAAATPTPPAVASGIVVFTAKAESWIEVTDARGVAALRRVLAPGEAAGASGALPLTVIVGRADATSVQVRGKPFNLTGVSKDNVARFEVK